MSLLDVSDIRPFRLKKEDYDEGFADAAPLLTKGQALLEAERCLYCYDAPCVHACPTGIDVPTFIHRIADGNLRGAARTILDANPLGATCARVCPTEELCESVCVRVKQEGRPVEIGRLQRFAVDLALAQAGAPLYVRGADSGRRVAIVGAGPAGLACAHLLARLGHAVTIFDARPKSGGLNEYGLAAYKMTGDYAQRELAWLLEIGGIEIVNDWRLQTPEQLAALRHDYDALFLGIGLSSVHRLGIPGEDLPGVRDAVDFIADLRQADNVAALPIGRRVVVVGGGMTAIDAAVQARLLGAESVSIVYRRGPESMPASSVEREWAQTRGVNFLHWLAPEEIIGHRDRLVAVRFARQRHENGDLVYTGEDETLPCDMLFKAIGQRLGPEIWTASELALERGRLKVDAEGRTSLPGVWAGGDCCHGGRDLTVEAVEDGKRAARSIASHLAALEPGARGVPPDAAPTLKAES